MILYMTLYNLEQALTLILEELLHVGMYRLSVRMRMFNF